MAGFTSIYERIKAKRAWGDAQRAAGPGLLLAGVLSMAARFLSEHYGGPAMLYALLFGMAFNFLATDEKFAAGVDAASKTILRIGVALLGARITANQVAALGWQTAAMVVLAVAATVAVGWGLGRAFRLKSDHAILSAGAVAICGASAAMALAAVLPHRKESEANTILTVVGVTTLSTLAMILYPYVAQVLNFSDHEAGVFLGGTIHDVAQVVGAGHMISDEAGETATIVKLIRVACLAPVVVILTMLFRTGARGASAAPALFMPSFLIAFIAIVAINSFGLIPSGATELMAGASSWCITAAVAALGVKTSLQDLVKVGPRPLAAMGAQTVWLAVFVLGWMLAARGF